jgi:hypothetical protein
MLGPASQTSCRQHSSIINPQTQGEEHVQVHFCGCCHSRSSTQTSLILSALTSVPLVLPPGLAVSIRKVVSDMTIVHTCKAICHCHGMVSSSNLVRVWTRLSHTILSRVPPRKLQQASTSIKQLVIVLKVKTVG